MAEFCCELEPTTDAGRAFLVAVKARDAAAVGALVARFPELRKSLEEPWFEFEAPAIVYAAKKRDRRMIDTLLAAGADINARSRWWAGGFGVLDGNTELAEFLIERGARVDVHAAAALGDRERLRELIGEIPELVHAPGGDGQRPLHFACDPETAAWLLDHGAEIDARDKDHRSTAAQYALRDRPEVTRFLIERGARADLLMAAALGEQELVERLLEESPEHLDARVGAGEFPAMTDPVKDAGHIYQWVLGGGRGPLQVALEFGHQDIYELLFARCPPARQLLAACWCGEETRAREVLAGRPGLIGELSTEEQGQLARAAWERRSEAVRLMLALGFDVDARDHEGSALDRVSVRGDADLVALLIAQGADLEARNAFGGTPLSACAWGSIHFRDPAGNYPATLRALLRAGASAEEPESADLAGLLRWCAAEGGLSAMEALVEAGVPVDLPNAEGKTALALAEANGEYEIADWLREHGATAQEPESV